MSARFRFFSYSPAFAFGLIAAVMVLPAAIFTAARVWVERAVAFAFDVLARPVNFIPGFGRLAFDGPAPAYDAPPIHALRHEAGTPRRAADRNI